MATNAISVLLRETAGTRDMADQVNARLTAEIGRLDQAMGRVAVLEAEAEASADRVQAMEAALERTGGELVALSAAVAALSAAAAQAEEEVRSALAAPRPRSSWGTEADPLNVSSGSSGNPPAFRATLSGPLRASVKKA